MASSLDKKDLTEIYKLNPIEVNPAFKRPPKDDNGSKIQAQDRIDPLTEVIGEYGPWQFKWHFLVGVTAIFHGWQMMSNKFLTFNSDYWCAPPEAILNGTGAYPVEQWINISTPLDMEGNFDFCHVFDVDYDSFQQDRPDENTPIRSCSHWNYDKSLFQVRLRFVSKRQTIISSFYSQIGHHNSTLGFSVPTSALASHGSNGIFCWKFCGRELEWSICGLLRA